jgi:hypothetical protein
MYDYEMQKSCDIKILSIEGGKVSIVRKIKKK